jgi:hypothetical protein
MILKIKCGRFSSIVARIMSKGQSIKVIKEFSKEVREMLIDYWNTIPITKSVNYHEVLKQTKKIERTYILKVLGIGIKDEMLGKTRHVLSANEIIHLLNKEFDFEIAKSNLYYHLSKLHEIELLDIVIIIQKGNILTNYYAKTSKLIWYKDWEIVEDHAHFQDDNLDILLKRMNKHLTDQKILEMKKKLKKLDRYYHDEFMKWIKENEEYFRGLDINFLQELADLFNKINYYTPHWLKLDFSTQDVWTELFPY